MKSTVLAAPYTALPHDLVSVPGADLITAGTTQVVVTCPNCSGQHRHLGHGLRRSPCGVHYVVTPPPARTSKLAAA